MGNRWLDSLNKLLLSKEAKDMSQFIPYGPVALGTLERLNTIVHDAKEGDPSAVETVKAIKAQSDVGDTRASEAVRTMRIISKAQDLKTAKSRSFYARGMSVGHDPITFGAVRDQRGGAGGGGGVAVTPGLIANAVKASKRDKGALVDWRGGKPQQVSNYGKGALKGSPWQNFGTGLGPQSVVYHPEGGPMKVSPFPAAPTQPTDPYAQSTDPYANPYGDPYANPYGGYDPYANPYGGGYPYDPYANPYGYGGYPLPGLPPGYGYEEPILDQGGFQQYDAATDSFYSSNQKQVYDESTGMFYPANDSNPYNPYGF